MQNSFRKLKCGFAKLIPYARERQIKNLGASWNCTNLIYCFNVEDRLALSSLKHEITNVHFPIIKMDQRKNYANTLPILSLMKTYKKQAAHQD